MADLGGRVVVVTGGSRGLGLAIATGFAKAGADVLIASRKLEACKEVAKSITKETGSRAVPVACHVGRWAECTELCDRAYSEFGRVDVLVNNAGMSPVYPSLAEVSEELFDKVLSVNLKGPFRLGALFGTRMMEGGGGSIINISSLAALRPTPDEIPYAAAKAGIENMTLGMARAFAPTVRVNSIMPGWFQTSVSEAWEPALLERQLDHLVAMKRVGQPSEIVDAALFLGSDSASYMTGAVMRIDGGGALAPSV